MLQWSASTLKHTGWCTVPVVCSLECRRQRDDSYQQTCTRRGIAHVVSHSCSSQPQLACSNTSDSPINIVISESSTKQPGVWSQSESRSVGVLQSPGFGQESLISRRLRLRALSVSSRLLCNFVAVCLIFMQFILQIKLCLYTIMHLLLEEFKISLKSSLSIQSVCHTISSRVGAGVPQKNKNSTSLHRTQKQLFPTSNFSVETLAITV